MAALHCAPVTCPDAHTGTCPDPDSS